MNIGTIIIGILIIAGIIIFLSCIRTIRPTQRGLIERWGKFNRFGNPGLNLLIPFIESLIIINVTEWIADTQTIEVITKDKLNARVRAQTYVKVKSDSESVKNSQYNVYNYQDQIVQLLSTTLRNVIGNMELSEANSQRSVINDLVRASLEKETAKWGIEIMRVELREIDPPANVQAVMNEVVVAENQKIASVNFANATEIKADGEKRAEIKRAEAQKQKVILDAEGKKQQQILFGEGSKSQQIFEAEGKAKAIELVNMSITSFFLENAQKYKYLETMQASMQNNSKIIIAEKGITPMLFLGDVDNKPFPLKETKK